MVGPIAQKQGKGGFVTTIVWFRDDLRLADNPALAWAAERGDVIALYIYDDATEGLRALGGASVGGSASRWTHSTDPCVGWGQIAD